MYGAEIWGSQKQMPIEIIHNYACKRYMCVNQKTVNAAVLGDCGRFPMFIKAAQRCVKYWCKILKMPDSRLVKKSYLMLKNLDCIGQRNWASDIRKLLCENGFGYIWFDQQIQHEKHFLDIFVQRLKDQYIQEWLTILNTSSKLYSYRQYMNEILHESYLNCITVRKFRHSLAKLRCSSHDLEIEKGRYYNIAKENRICKLCYSAVETEFHFVLVCEKLADIREKYIPRKYYTNTNPHKYIILMSSSSEHILQNLGMYVFYAFQKRKELLASAP